MNNKKNNLCKILEKLGKVAIAFSGGIDSCFLLAVSHKVLKNKLLAITTNSIIHHKKEILFAQEFAKNLNIKHIIFDSNEMQNPDFIGNSQERCYFCKKNLFSQIYQIASQNGFYNILHGANLDDLSDFRPGMKAAYEFNIFSPLINADLTKKEIRILSKEMGLNSWNKPNMSCLATRIPYFMQIDLETLNKIEKAEEFLLDLNFSPCRVRILDNKNKKSVKIELKQDNFEKFLEDSNYKKVSNYFKSIGFLDISLNPIKYSL